MRDRSRHRSRELVGTFFEIFFKFSKKMLPTDNRLVASLAEMLPTDSRPVGSWSGVNF
jgi:hypothetical protein